MNIDAKKLNERLNPIKLLEYIGYEKSQPKVSGDEIRDFCPIHKGDNKLSLSINQQTHCFFCHSCQEKGDLIDLYMKSLNIMDFPTAINDLTTKFAFDPVSNPYQNTSYTQPQKERQNTQNTTPTQPKIAESTSNELAVAAWSSAIDEGHHEYFSRKKVAPCLGVRYGDDKMGNPSIVVPFYDVLGKIQTVQYINNSGKFFLSGANQKGFFFPLGKIQDGIKVYIAEGLATAITIYDSLGKKHPVVSAGSSGNINSVVDGLQKEYPKIQIVLALDNDESGKGVLKKIKPSCAYCIPNFDRMSVPDGEKAKDFNDLISVCSQSLEVVREQIQKGWRDYFFSELGNIIEDVAFANRLNSRTYYTFEAEHKKLFAGGGLVTGFKELDEKLLFSKGDFVTIQAMSNHGKSTFMLQLAHKFVTAPGNTPKNPICVFITYESSPIRIEEKLINIISHDRREGTAITYDRNKEEKYLYPDHEDFPESIATYNNLLLQRQVEILKRIPLEKLEGVVDLYRKTFPERMLILFLDYFQIIDTDINLDGWERVKEVARRLEAMAITKEILIITASQVNDRRQTREGRDLYNYSTTVLDVLNHSHASLKSNQDTEKLFRDKLEGEAVCTISAFKQKHGDTFDLKERFLFNGFRFKESSTLGQALSSETRSISNAQHLKTKK